MNNDNDKLMHKTGYDIQNPWIIVYFYTICSKYKIIDEEEYVNIKFNIQRWFDIDKLSEAETGLTMADI